MMKRQSLIPDSPWRRVVLILLQLVATIHAFTSPQHRQQQTKTRTALCARPPPIARFDLEAIEAFEHEMDLHEEQQQQLQVDHLVDDDDDDIFDEASMSYYVDSNPIQILTVPPELDGKRIDAVLASLLEPSMSRSVCGSLVANGHVHHIQGGKTTLLDRKSCKVDAGTVLQVTMPQDSTPDRIGAQNLPLSVLYEDEHFIVLNKAAGMVVHPAAGNWEGTVVNALAYYLTNNSTYGSGEFVQEDGSIKNIASKNALEDDPVAEADGESSTLSFRPGIVHRLDKGTTGILVVAKTTQALTKLSEAFANRTVKKTYLAITVGNPGKQVKIDKPIGRHPMHRQRMRVVPDPHRKDSSGTTPQERKRIKSMEAALASGSAASTKPSLSQSGRRALSYVDTLAFDGKLSLARVRIETGRTHQIRVHLQDRHTPIYGDEIYGIADWNKQLKKTHGIERPLLHAYRLELNHPVTDEPMVFEAPMAEDMRNLAKIIWKEGPEELPRAFSEES
jgi:23S rRNA pseudouridine1911/1915/1917 synthase